MSEASPLPARLRVLVVNWLDRENPKAGGAETHMHQIFGRLAGRGHEVSALVSGWRGCALRTTLDGIDVHRSGSRYTFSLTAPAYYRRHLAGHDFHVVVEDLNKVPLFTPYWTNVPVVVIAHHLFGATAFQAASLPVALGTWILERPIPAVFGATPAIAVSESTKEDLVRRGLRPEMITVIPNGIDVEYFTPGPEPEAAPRPTLLYLGRLKKYKRIDLVVEATAALAQEGIDVELWIGGDGDQAEALREQGRRLGIADRVRLLGFLDETEKRDALRRAWVHVLTSPKEGWGISNLEAAACGTPSVVSDAPGLRESVADGRTGILVPHGNVPALTRALSTLLRDSEMRERMGRQAREFAETLLVGGLRRAGGGPSGAGGCRPRPGLTFYPFSTSSRRGQVNVHITTRHCEVPADILERTEQQVASLSKYSPRASSADVVFLEEKLDKVIEVIVHIDGDEPVVARAQALEHLNALDKVVARLGRMLRKQRERLTEHQGSPKWERAGQG